MKLIGLVPLLFLITFVAEANGAAQNQGSPNTSPGSVQSTIPLVNPDAQSSWIRILTPVAGQTLSSNFVNLRFELVRPALNGEPNFIVQLDSSDPINMEDTDYTFTDLQPGAHVIRVALVDANNSPVEGGSATVQFKVPAPGRNNASQGTKQQKFTHNIIGSAPSMPIPPELCKDGDPILPLAGSPLPMLSVIGFGLLIGGAAQAMRHRR